MCVKFIIFDIYIYILCVLKFLEKGFSVFCFNFWGQCDEASVVAWCMRCTYAPPSVSPRATNSPTTKGWCSAAVQCRSDGLGCSDDDGATRGSGSDLGDDDVNLFRGCPAALLEDTAAPNSWLGMAPHSALRKWEIHRPYIFWRHVTARMRGHRVHLHSTPRRCSKLRKARIY